MVIPTERASDLFSWDHREPSYLARIHEPSPGGGGEIWELSECDVREALAWAAQRADGRQFDLAVVVDDVEDESDHGLVWLLGPYE